MLFLNPVVQADNAEIWHGRVNDLKIQWTESDIRVFNQDDKNPVFSARALAEQDFQQLEPRFRENDCIYQRQFNILSIVGNIASFKDVESLTCQTSSNSFENTRFFALNLRNGREVKLTDLFSETNIFNALLKDFLIQQNLSHHLKEPKTFENLRKILNRQDILFNDCVYNFDSVLPQFAFHYLKNNKVFVRLGLSSALKNCRFAHIERTVYLPIPKELKSIFIRAKSRKAGFLMAQAQKIAKARSTTIRFSPEKQNDSFQAIQQVEETPLRIVIASGVRVAEKPRSGTKIIGLLSIGTVIEVLEHTEKKEIISDVEEYWYQIQLKNGDKGWIFGSWTRPFEEKQAVTIYRRLIHERLKMDLIFADQADLTYFINKVAKQIQILETKGEFELLYLLSIKKSLDIITQLEAGAYQSKPYKNWLKEHQSYILSDESVGVFLLDPAVFWRLHDKYYPLPIAEKMAWTGVENAVASEMGNYLTAILDYLNESLVKYLKIYPKGIYAEEALNRIADSINPNHDYHETENQSDSSSELQQLLNILHSTVAQTDFPQTPKLLTKIEQLKERVK